MLKYLTTRVVASKASWDAIDAANAPTASWDAIDAANAPTASWDAIDAANECSALLLCDNKE